MNSTQHFAPVPEINEISSLLADHYDAPHMTFYYEAGLSEPELDSPDWEFVDLDPGAAEAAVGSFVQFLGDSLEEFAYDPNPQFVAKVAAYRSLLPQIGEALRQFVQPASRVLRQVSEFDNENTEGLRTYYFRVDQKWFYLSFGRIDTAEG